MIHIVGRSFALNLADTDCVVDLFPGVVSSHFVGIAGQWDATFGPTITSMVDRQRGRTSPVVPMPNRPYKALVRCISSSNRTWGTSVCGLKVSVVINDALQGHFTQASS